MINSKLICSVLIAAVLPVSLAACGGSSSTDSAIPTASGSNFSVPGDKPVSTQILIDRTPLLDGDSTLARSYKQAALQAATPTIKRGGQLKISVFGRVAAHALTLYTTNVPSLKQAGDAARDDAAQLAALSQALDIAVGLTPPPSQQIRAALRSVTPTAGSDPGAAIGQAISDLNHDPSPTRNVILETDGWIVRQHQPTLSHVLAKHGPRAAADVIVNNAAVPAGTRAVSLLQIQGLGSTAGIIGPDAQTMQNLNQAYQKACTNLPVHTCQINTGT